MYPDTLNGPNPIVYSAKLDVLATTAPAVAQTTRSATILTTSTAGWYICWLTTPKTGGAGASNGCWSSTRMTLIQLRDRYYVPSRLRILFEGFEWVLRVVGGGFLEILVLCEWSRTTSGIGRGIFYC